MSLNGSLKHFPVIDVIQLLHGARKTGVLRISCEDKMSQLVFHEGDLVSANYLNNRVRIGQVLVSAGAITEAQLARALDIQKNAGEDRKPLIITLLEHDMVDEKAAYNGLEALIEMTIVEALTWKDGVFSLEIDQNNNANGCHFSGTEFSQRILLNSQGILMESLRILDEKVRDGEMDEILSIAGVDNLDLDAEQPDNNLSVTAADERKQDNLQRLFAEQRNMVQCSSDHSFRTVDVIRKLIVEEFPCAANEQKVQLLSILSAPVMEEADITVPSGVAVIVITKSQLLSAMVRSICCRERIFAVSTDDIASIDIKIRLLLCQMLRLVILLDVPHDEAMQDTLQICTELGNYPQASVVLLACSRFWNRLGLRALGAGVHSIIPRPCRECAEESLAEQALAFCSGLGDFLCRLSSEYCSNDEQSFFSCISRLRGCKTRMEVAVSVLDYLMELFERAILFQVTKTGLVAELSFGVDGAKSEGITSLANLSIPLDDQGIFEDVIKSGQMYYGFHSDSTWPHQMYRLIGRPDSPEILVFPMIRANTVIAFVYADFGTKPAPPSPPLSHLNALTNYTTAQVSILAYRQKLKSMLEQMRMQAQNASE